QRSVAIKPFLKYVVQKHLGDTKVLGKFHDQALKHLSLHDHIYLLSLTGNKLARESLSIVLNNQMSASYSVELLGNYRDVIRGLEVRRRLVIRLDRLIAQKEALLANTLEELLGVSDNSGVAYTWSMLRKLKGVVLSLDKNNMRDISAVFSNIERVLSTQYNIEHQTLLRQFEEFISLAKLAVKGGYAIPEREMTLLSFVGQVYSKKTDSIYFSYLENMLSDRSYSQYTFSGLLMESLTLKYLLAVSPHKKLKELSRDQISLITTLISDLQERLVQNIFAETEFDQIENIYLDSISEYHATISDVPIWGTLSCEQASSCYFDLRYSNNIGPITTVESGPLLYEGKLNYPVSALGVRQNAVREGAFRFYDQSALTISAIPSDILIVDVSIKEEEAPQKPLKGYHGRPRITEVLQKRVKYCKRWAKIGKWCLDHDYKQVNYAHEVQSMQNGFSGRDGVSGANSSDIHFDFSRSMTGSEFSKIIVFNSSGDGGEGADGGSRGGGSMPGSFGAGGDPGRIGTIDVISNPRQIPIIQIGKVGLKGKDGVTGN
ncbi:MAG: hypothetical protein KAG61_07045, partial [Bacteriovoracaceae bacterium]|nr:hypothetical protein [Bacteriovoracaceae bacterium]